MNILLVKTSSMGDVIHNLPALSDLQCVYPQANLHWVIEESFQEIGHFHPMVKAVIPVAWRRWRHQWWQRETRCQWQQFKAQLRQCQYDLIIDSQGLCKSAWFARYAKGVRHGYDRDSAREGLASYAYHKSHQVAKTQHAITRIRELFAKSIDYDVDLASPVDYGVVLQENTTLSKPSVMLVHGSSRQDKCWPEPLWQQVIRHLKDMGFSVLLPWGNKDESARARRLAGSGAEVLPAMSLTSIAAMMQACDGVLAVDTGLAHLAAAINVPSVTLYGPTDPALIGTQGFYQSHAAFHISPQDLCQRLRSLMAVKADKSIAS